MNRHILALLILSALLTSCSTAPRIPLSQMRTERIYKIDKENMFGAIRFFSKHEGFFLSNCNEETGVVIGYKREEGYNPVGEIYEESTGIQKGADAGKERPGERRIFMNLKVTEVGAEKCKIKAHFSFSNIEGTIMKSDEDIIVDWYNRLFDQISAFGEEIKE